MKFFLLMIVLVAQNVFSQIQGSRQRQTQTQTNHCQDNCNNEHQHHYRQSAQYRVDFFYESTLTDLNKLIKFIEGKVGYEEYGEIFRPLQRQIASLQNTILVYKMGHRITFDKTIELFTTIDNVWSEIEKFKDYDNLFETINCIELIILELKRNTYL